MDKANNAREPLFIDNAKACSLGMRGKILYGCSRRLGDEVGYDTERPAQAGIAKASKSSSRSNLTAITNRPPGRRKRHADART